MDDRRRRSWVHLLTCTYMCRYTEGMNSEWKLIGGGVHMLKAEDGHYHVMQHSKTVWSATFNGRPIGTAKTLQAAQALINA